MQVMAVHLIWVEWDINCDHIQIRYIPPADAGGILFGLVIKMRFI